MLVIDETGHKLGEFLTEDAVQLANDRGFDLIEVAPDARPPVCRIGDFGQLKYQNKKRAAQARKNQVQVQIKEVKVRPKTDDHDMAVKVKHSRRFLEEGNKVKVTVRFRGRELAHRDIGAQQCLRIAELLAEISAIESPPRMDGRQMFMILAPTIKPIRRASKKEDGTGKEDTEELDDLTDDDDDDLTDDEDDADDEGEGDEEGDEAGEDEPEA